MNKFWNTENFLSSNQHILTLYRKLLTRSEHKEIHTNYNQTIAATGRLSRHRSKRKIFLYAGKAWVMKFTRKAFVAEDGFKLAALDYSQIELRIVAHLAQDQNMMEVFKHQGDIHTRTASAILRSRTR
ncbi:MAG: DNA polymerase [Candidatus Doudnabacteria bacterium]